MTQSIVSMKIKCFFIMLTSSVPFDDETLSTSKKKFGRNSIVVAWPLSCDLIKA